MSAGKAESRIALVCLFTIGGEFDGDIAFDLEGRLIGVKADLRPRTGSVYTDAKQVMRVWDG